MRGIVKVRAGNETRFETRARRSIPGDRSSDFIALLLKMSVATAADPQPVSVALAFATTRENSSKTEGF
jgi:hypothetical protein